MTPSPPKKAQRGSLRRSVAAVVTRSSTIASTTIARPALNAVPTSSVCNAFTTVLPRPGASISAAIVTIDNAAMIVWLTPSTIVLRADGSSTFTSVCCRVAPRDSEASTVLRGTERMACAVIRIAGGAA